MEIWVWVLIGCIILVVIMGLVFYLYMKNRSKILKQDLFDGEAYCYVVQKLKKDTILGKRKTYPGLAYSKKIITSKQVADLYNFYFSEEVKVKQQAAIKQCFKNLQSKGIEVPELEDGYYDEEVPSGYQDEDYSQDGGDTSKARVNVQRKRKFNEPTQSNKIGKSVEEQNENSQSQEMDNGITNQGKNEINSGGPSEECLSQRSILSRIFQLDSKPSPIVVQQNQKLRQPRQNKTIIELQKANIITYGRPGNKTGKRQLPPIETGNGQTQRLQDFQKAKNKLQQQDEDFSDIAILQMRKTDNKIQNNQQLPQQQIQQLQIEKHRELQNQFSQSHLQQNSNSNNNTNNLKHSQTNEDIGVSQHSQSNQQDIQFQVNLIKGNKTLKNKSLAQTNKSQSGFTLLDRRKQSQNQTLTINKDHNKSQQFTQSFGFNSTNAFSDFSKRDGLGLPPPSINVDRF